jgi:hypothetical protein
MFNDDTSGISLQQSPNLIFGKSDEIIIEKNIVNKRGREKMVYETIQIAIC